jgi:hypothetical protein
MTNRFEQLIEYVINDEEQKARELFHQIVVEKSREIYENLMQEDDAMGRMDRYDEAMGGDQSEDLIDDVEVDETGLSEADDEVDMEVDSDEDMGDEDMGDEDMGNEDMGGKAASLEQVADEVADLRDRFVDLETEIDDLVNEFLSSENQDSNMGMDMDMDMADTEMETEGMMRHVMDEAVSLKAAPKPVTSEEGGINKSSTVPANSGARGAMASPVKMTGDTAQGRPAPSTKDLIGRVGNTPAQSGSPKLAAAPKPHLAQATGVNTKTPFPRS